MTNFKLSSAGRIRIVVGVGALCLGWMEYFFPSTSVKWGWLKNLAQMKFGDNGYIALLVFIGLIFIGWAIVEALYKKGESE